MKDMERIVLRDLFGSPLPERYGKFVPLHPGVDLLPLYGFDERGNPRTPSGPKAGFLRYEPGASVPSHRHPGYEHIIVLQGAQRDERGSYPAGTCLISPPTSGHSVVSDEGCLVLAIWNQSVELLE